ncbi:MAG: TetR/AcrR family transcriptional regulator [Calditrichia bacterium]
MGKRDTKQHILEVAADIVHLKGFNATGIQEVLAAAGVPKGSFYFHFKSKEDFGLQLLDFYDGHFDGLLQKALAGPEGTVLEKLRLFFRGFRDYFAGCGYTRGCPIGNLAQEMGDQNEAFRQKIAEVWQKMTGAVAAALEQARQVGELPVDFPVQKTAEFIVNSWEGALIRQKITRNSEPLDLFEEIIFGKILK